jgi:hypothetical protein
VLDSRREVGRDFVIRRGESKVKTVRVVDAADEAVVRVREVFDHEFSKTGFSERILVSCLEGPSPLVF